MKEELSETTAELKLTKGKLTSLEEEHNFLKESKLTVLEKENKSLVDIQTKTKLQVVFMLTICM